MKSSITHVLPEVDQLLSNKQYKSALDLLEQVSIRERESDQNLSMYHYSLAKSYRGLGDYERALSEIQMALSLSREAEDHSLYGSQKNMLGLVYMALGRITDAVTAYNEAYAAGKAAGENQGLYRLLANQAFAHYLRGDLTRALSVLYEARQHAKAHNGENEIRLCDTNISRVMLFLGKFKDAAQILTTYEHAENITSSDMAFVWQSFGMLHTYRLDSEKAREYFNKALGKYRELGMTREIVVTLEYMGLNESYAGNLEKAKQLFGDILRREGLTTSAYGQTKRMLAEVFLAEGSTKMARNLADQAERDVDEVREKIEKGAIDRIYGQIHALQGDWDKARKRFREAISLLSELGASYELALTYRASARSGLHDTSESLSLLRIAQGLFQQMDVLKRVAQTEKELSELAAKQEHVQLGFWEALRIPWLRRRTTFRQVYSLVRFPLLAISLLSCILSFLFFKGTYVGFGLFVGSGLLAAQTIVMMRAAARGKKKQASS